jgi:protein subunit release factor B
MYRMYGQKQGWNVTELDWQDGDRQGSKPVHSVRWPVAFGFLKAEVGYTAWFVFHHLTVMQGGILPLLPYTYTHD